ncbi:hypothetical protein [Haloarchaeobius iranensis]|uniref:Uncharacterized protein n=1 Tax=Haloarchaeobius iranensis TaxID=996166 RepID=A0A1H0BWJ7_9EURY|nr:hypothetical protein [Haloarchaeobius iranensis]SDN50059.1 hypothetical protein SAMN05192554_1504 [Haloarchaeobius iranensis]
MDERYFILFIADEDPDVRSIVDRCIEMGLKTTSSGGTERFEKYEAKDGSGSSIDVQNNEVETVVDKIAKSKKGELTFWYDEPQSTDLKLSFVGSKSSDWPTHRVMVSFRTLPLQVGNQSRAGDYSEAAVESRVKTIIDVLVEIIPFVDPEYAYSTLWVGQNPVEGLQPTGKPIPKHIQEIGWLTIMSESTVEDFGGFDHVLDTPAWCVQRLDTGHVMIVKSDRPVAPTKTPSAELADHLIK